MAGIQLTQLSPGPTVNAAGVQNPAQQFAGFLQSLACTATFVGTPPTTLAWQLAQPALSRSFLATSTGVPVQQGVPGNVLGCVFTPDIAGPYEITALDQSGNAYTLQVLVQPTAGTFYPGTLSPASVAPSLVQTPPAGQVNLFCDSTNSGALSEKVPDGSFFVVGSGLSAQIDPQGTAGNARNSLTVPAIRFPEWRAISAVIQIQARMETVVTPYDGDLVNGNKNASGNGEINHAIAMCPGATGGTWNVHAKVRTGSANNDFRLLVLDNNNSVLFGPVVCNATQTPQTFSVVASGLAQNHLYQLALQVNDHAQQCDPVIDFTEFVPNGGTGTFALPFRRFRITAGVMNGNQDAGIISGVLSNFQPLSEISMLTNSPTLGIESYNLGQDGKQYFLSKGKPFADAAVVVANGALAIEDVPNLPIAGRRMEEFKIRTGQSNGVLSAANLGTQTSGTAPRAVYAPESANLIMVRPTGPVMVCFGDSIMLGFGSTDLGFQGWIETLRESWPGSTVIMAYNSQSLYGYVGTAGASDATKTKQVAIYLSRNRPQVILIDLLANDYAQANWTAAAYGTGLQNLFTQLLSLNPNGIIVYKTAGLTNALEGIANGVGSTPPNYRTQGIAAVAAVGGGPVGSAPANAQVFSIDASTIGGFHTASQMVDNYHPNTIGHAADGYSMVLQFRTLKLV